MKTLFKLLLTAAIANAGWHVSEAWLAYFRFKDAVAQAAQFGSTMSTPQLQARVLELATQYSIPVSDDALSVRRDNQIPQHTFIDATYDQPIELIPRVTYPWTFQVHVDTFSEAAARPSS